jgi:hypothetical protein
MSFPVAPGDGRPTPALLSSGTARSIRDALIDAERAEFEHRSAEEDFGTPANTFVVIEADDVSRDWFASVALADGETDIGHIAGELTIWLAGASIQVGPVAN